MRVKDSRRLVLNSVFDHAIAAYIKYVNCLCGNSTLHEKLKQVKTWRIRLRVNIHLNVTLCVQAATVFYSRATYLNT